MHRNLLVLAALTFLPAVPAKSAERSYLPPNDWSVPEDSKAARGLNQAQYDQVLDAVAAVYAPIIRARGGRLSIERAWSNAQVNAFASRSGSAWIVHLAGGLPRLEGVTQDGFASVVCHEIGHHLGGAPRKGDEGLSNEGQSDYFSFSKCLRRVFAASASASFTREAATDPAALQACAASFQDPSQRAVCARGAMAALSMSKAIHNLEGGRMPSFGTPDRRIVRQTEDGHPAGQCRLDTSFQGSLCAKPVSEDFDDDDPKPGACTASQGFAVGLRPRCWYKPPASEPDVPFRRAALTPGAALSALVQGVQEAQDLDVVGVRE